MSTRREFMQSGAAVAAALALADATATASETGATSYAADAARVPSLPRMGLYRVIADDQLTPSLEFEEHAARLGLATCLADSDVTSLWYHDLQPRWIRSPAAIAGLTSPESLFCLERLAWDHSMRVLLRTTHVALSAECIQHHLTGPTATVLKLAQDYARGEDWARDTSRAIAAFPAQRGPLVLRTVLSHTNRAADLLDRPLVSWVIGPVPKMGIS